MRDLLEEVKKFKEVESKKIKTKNCWTPNDIILYDNYAEVILRDNKQKIKGVTKIDLGDLELVKSHKWCLHPRGYATTPVNKKPVKLHQLILNQPKDKIGHHINSDKLDNRRKNLILLDKKYHTAVLHRSKQIQRIISVDEKSKWSLVP